MDKHLKELNYEKNLKTSFTKENKRMVLDKIHKVEQNRKTKPHYFQNALAVVLTGAVLFLGITFISNNDVVLENASETNQSENQLGNNQNDEGSIAVPDNDKEQEKKELVVGGKYSLWDAETLSKRDPDTDKVIYYDYSDPNYNLFAAHLKAAVITQNSIYMAGGIHGEVDHPTFIEYLESIILFLDNIKPGEDKLLEFKKAKQIAEQALEQEVSRWDPILDELHEVLHELDEYYNVNPFIDGRTSHDGMIIFPEPEE
ncbi:polyphosphate kinase [Solibacillus sp. FSL R5-0449]|uniref:polyphosphate kinase n=1 Tax=Solibacillus sp. FSL R5-0449 TaxID=2921639 RepID=UPI0030D4B18E